MNISIITPSLNSEKYIYNNLKSIHLQQKGNFSIEQIIVDGQSTDRTIEIIEAFREKHNANIKVIQGKDRNMYDAINKGLKAMSGDIWACLNTDDLYHKDIISLIIKEFSKNEDLDLVYGYLDIIDEDGNFLNTVYLPKFDLEYFILKRECLIINQPAIFLRRNVLDKVGYFDTNYNYASDYDYIIRVTSKCKIKLISNVLTQFRQHKNSISCDKNSNSVQRNESISISKKYINEFQIEQKNLFFGNLKFYTKQLKPKNSIYIAKKINQTNLRGLLAEFLKKEC